MTKIFVSYEHSAAATAIGLANFLNISLEHVGAIALSSDLEEVRPISDFAPLVNNIDVLIAVTSKGDFPANLMFEIGYALALGKGVILVSETHNARLPPVLSKLPLYSTDNRPSWKDEIARLVQGFSSPTLGERFPKKLSARDYLFEMTRSPKVFEFVSPQFFEELVARYLSTEVDALDVTFIRDAPYVDIVCKHKERNSVFGVETKKYAHHSLVGISEVLKLAEGVSNLKLDFAVLITTGDYSPSARDFAERSSDPISLLTIHDLLTINAENFITSVDPRERHARFDRKWF